MKVIKKCIELMLFVLWITAFTLLGATGGFLFPGVVLSVTVNSWFDDPLAWILGGGFVGLLCAVFSWSRFEFRLGTSRWKYFGKKT